MIDLNSIDNSEEIIISNSIIDEINFASLIFSKKVCIIDIETECKMKKERDRLHWKKKSSCPVSLKLGVYKNESITLSLDNNFLYQIQYHLGEYSPIISEGKWSKEGNVLKLYDSFLDYSFTALIGTGEIIVIDFPNDVNSNYNYFLMDSEHLLVK